MLIKVLRTSTHMSYTSYRTGDDKFQPTDHQLNQSQPLASINQVFIGTQLYSFIPPSLLVYYRVKLNSWSQDHLVCSTENVYHLALYRTQKCSESKPYVLFIFICSLGSRKHNRYQLNKLSNESIFDKELQCKNNFWIMYLFFLFIYSLIDSFNDY